MAVTADKILILFQLLLRQVGLAATTFVVRLEAIAALRVLAVLVALGILILVVVMVVLITVRVRLAPLGEAAEAAAAHIIVSIAGAFFTLVLAQEVEAEVLAYLVKQITVQGVLLVVVAVVEVEVVPVQAKAAGRVAAARVVAGIATILSVVIVIFNMVAPVVTVLSVLFGVLAGNAAHLRSHQLTWGHK